MLRHWKYSAEEGSYGSGPHGVDSLIVEKEKKQVNKYINKIITACDKCFERWRGYYGKE